MNTPESIECCHCETSFEWTRSDTYQRKPHFCAVCTAAVIERDRLAELEKLEDEIASLTPSRYQATDTAHPEFNRRLWERIQVWKPTDERPWLGMIGPTGESKTRSAFLILAQTARCMVRPAKDLDSLGSRPSLAAVSAYRLTEAVLGQFQDEQKAASVELLRRLRKVSILLIDDLGKQRNTPAVSGELFALLDHRHAENLATIWTSNSTPEGIVAGMPDDMAAPLSGRIRECSTIINLG